MITFRKHYDVFRQSLTAVMILYLLLAGCEIGAVALARTDASSDQSIQNLERRLDRMDRDWERLDAPQRLARLEACMQAAKENSESNRQMFLVILCGILLILAAVIVLLIGRTQPRASVPPPSKGAEFNAAVAVVLKHEGGTSTISVAARSPSSASRPSSCRASACRMIGSSFAT